jgi:hypothetical protein
MNMTNNAVITIEAVEALATRLETEVGAQREKLVRLIKAYSRIIAQREPQKFPCRSTEYKDEDGHFDNSYPPKQVYKCRTGPQLLKICDNITDDIATSGSFYHDWKRVTEDPGLFISPDGTLFGCNEHGTGSFGQFAAHPGNWGVEVELEWSPLDLDQVSTLRLIEAECFLRKLAFPQN